MLLKYIVSNYKSIGHEIEFSMLPTAEDTDERFISKIQTKQGEMGVLHRGILLGTNAYGKSTGGERYGGRGCHDGRAGFLLG